MIGAAAASFGVAAAGPPKQANKLFDVRFSITYAYKWKLDRTISTGSDCKATYAGTGRAYAVIEGRSSWLFEGTSGWPKEKPNNARLKLERSGKLGVTEICGGRTLVHEARTTGCGTRRRSMTMSGHMDAGRRRGERETRYYPSVMQVFRGGAGDVWGKTWASLDPCPPSYEPNALISFARAGRIGFGNAPIADYEHPPLPKATLVRNRFIRRTWGPSESVPLKVQGPNGSLITVGDQTTATRFRMLFCAQSAGGCGSRRP